MEVWTSSPGIPVQAHRTHMVVEVLAVTSGVGGGGGRGWGGVPREGLPAFSLWTGMNPQIQFIDRVLQPPVVQQRRVPTVQSMPKTR